MSVPGSLIFGLLPLVDEAGVIAAGWKLHFLAAGTSDDKDTFYQSNLDPAAVNANPVVLDSSGLATIFGEAGGYDIEIYDENDVLQRTLSGWIDPGQTFAADLGVELATGSAGVSSGYTVLATDTFVTVSSTGGANPCLINLPAAADHPLPVTIKNMGTIPLSIVPNGAETIESIAAAFTVAAAASPNFPSVFLCNDGVSSYWIASSHGL